jgi:two-component system phosphate regulon sensor histidine kinase PhoR
MNRRFIIFTIIAMTIALIGLMGIQIFWIQSASAIRESNFRRSVNEAMVKVVSKIEQLEKVKSAKQERDERVASFSRHMPYDSIITLNELDSLIRIQLNIRSVDTRFQFCIYKPENQEFIMEQSAAYRKDLIEKGTAFVLFQADIYTSPEYLLVYFPLEKPFLLTELWGMLLISIILIIVIVYSFTYTLAIVFRQKRFSEMKNDFINNMTHEFKTPISTISLACEALSDKDMRTSAEMVESYVTMIREENRRLAMMAEKILQTAVLDKGQLKMNKEIIDLHQVIRDATRNIKIQVEIKDGEIIPNFMATRSRVEGDKVHLTNLVYNLLDNANKYTPRKPVIRIHTENVSNGIVMTIEDNGIGIGKAEQKKIFDKLYRIPTGNIHEVRGFGLGLSYVKAIVDEHHGKVSVESEVNKGTRLKVFLPFRIKE